MNNDNDLNLKDIRIIFDPARIIQAMNESFNILLAQSFPFLESMLRSHEIARRKEDIFPRFLRGKRVIVSPTDRAFEDVRRLFGLYVPAIDENLRKIMCVQKGLNELVLNKKEKISPVFEEIVEKIAEKKVDDILGKYLALLTNGETKSFS